MTPAIEQSVRFDCSPEVLFELYMDSAKHTAATGQRASISRRASGRFMAFGGALCGRNLLVIPKKMIVQAWRSTHWKRGDPDSILVLRFSKVVGGSRVDLSHVNVPHHDHAGVTKGWPMYYWKPWKAYLAARKRKS